MTFRPRPEPAAPPAALEEAPAAAKVDALLDQLVGQLIASPIAPAPGLRASKAPPPPPALKLTQPMRMAPPAAKPSVGRASTRPEAESQRPLQVWHQDALELIENCKALLADSNDARRRAQLHYEIGRLYDAQLNDAGKAAVHYERALEHIQDSVPLLRAARRVYLAQRAYEAALPLFDAEARLIPDTRRKAMLWLSKGRLLEDVLQRQEEAWQAYNNAYDLERSDPSVLKAIEQAAQQRGLPKELDQTYERLANVVAGDPRHRAALLVRKAKLIESKQGDAETAIELYEVALRLVPSEHSALEALKRLHHAQRRWRDLIRVLEVEAQHSTDTEVRITALYRIGRLHAERLGGQQEAITALERALRESPRDALLLEELARLYEGTEQHDALAATLQNLADTIREPEQRLSLLHRIGQLLEDKLDQPEQAIHWYELALQHRPTYTPALQSLGKLYTMREDWPALVRMHQRDAEHAEDNQRRASAHARVAEIYEVRLGRIAEAIEHYNRALSAIPSYAPAFKALSRLYSQLQQWRELVELYEREIDAAQGTAGGAERAVAFLFKAGSIYEDALQDFAQACHAFRRILELQSSNIGAIQGWQRAAERAGRYQELVEALHLEAEKAADAQRTVTLLQRAGEVLEDKLNDRNGALTRYRQVLQIDPTYVPALISLGRLYYRSGRWEDLLDMYRRELELTPHGPAAVALLEKMAELCEERIGRDDEALGYYQRAAELDPSYQPVLRATARRLQERERWGELVQTLEHELACVSSPHDRARIAYRIGEVHEERLDQPDKALEAYKQALDIVPDFRPARDGLARLLAVRRDWRTLVDNLEREAETTSDAALAISALLRQGELWASELSEAEHAAGCYRRVLGLQRDHLGALLALEGLYRRLGNWPALADIYREQATVLGDVGARVAALRELGRLQRRFGVGSLSDLRQTYEAILALAPTDMEALETMERMAFETSDRDLAIRIDSVIVEQLTEPAELAAYRLRLAEGLESRDDHRALEMYRSALQFAPDSLAATRGFSRMAERADDPEALAEAARREAQVAGDSKAAARLLVRSATLRLERLGDQAGARADLERALELSPDHAEAASGLATLLRQSKEESRLADLLSRAAGGAKDPARAAALWIEVATLHADALQNLGGGINALGRVLRAEPHHPEALRKLAELYERDGHWNEAVQTLQLLVQHTNDNQQRIEAHCQLASLWDERLGDTERARHNLQAALSLQARHNLALERLSDLQEREGNLREAVTITTRLIDAAGDDRVRAAAWVRLARVQRRLGDQEATVEALWQAVALEGPLGQASLECKNAFSTPSQWQRYVSALQQFMQTRAADTTQQVTSVLEMARVQSDRLASAEMAIATLEAGIDAIGDDPSLRTELALRLRMSGKHTASIAQLQHLLTQEPGRLSVWRDLAHAYREMKRPQEARLALAPIALVQSLQANEQAMVQAARPLALADLPTACLHAELLLQLDARSPAEDMAVELLRCISPGMGKLYPADLSAYGVTSRERLTAKSGNLLRQSADQLARIFGIEGFDLYVHHLRDRGVALEFGDTVSLLAPAWLEQKPEAQRTFLLARPLALVAQQMQAFEKLMPRELEVALAAAARHVEPAYGTGLTSEEFLNDWSKRIHRALPWRGRKAFDQAAEAYVALHKPNFAVLARRVRATATQIAAVLTDDLSACVEAMQQREQDGSRTEASEAAAHSTESVNQLLRFWASPKAMMLRQAMGLLNEAG